ncbi:alpha/beta hydrolase [Ramlibacter sp.]|uniref:alpha/beta hydrolase n=1 Tax=Ramlibacter sp. TaxID=1917967 RepID=UPI002FC80D93
MSKSLWIVLLQLAGGALACYGLVLAFLWWRQESMLFYPVPLPADHRLATAPDIVERTVDVPGARLSVLHLQRPGARGVVFFLHGNAGNLQGWFSNADFYRDAGYDLVMPDYRGFGKSTGRIGSASELREDVRAVWSQVAAQYRGRKVVLYGRSLGTGLAAELAQELSARGQPPDLTVLVSAYTSFRALAAEFYPWVPGWLLRYPLETEAHLPRIAGPVLLVHAEKDSLIRVHHLQRLRQVLPGARVLVVPGADHNDLHESPVYRDGLRRALGAL